ncbi:hypothetical protein [Rhodococcus sp. IEGM 1379]|uniref:hypothetical protein n=1 Tax=Rhodococcus sp. IEGM 1379 TaxID=3047086 RepID=UPI0024B672B1|nr:hypothetical protein [Rhodococcus sp. IEGM 1379]MDI9913989.1 hypothetical protein [Rhodococcus sp. IEGM 1379]
MKLYPDGLESRDAELWDAALETLARTYRTGRHEVAAAIRTNSGAIHTGVHIAGSAGRSSICAEGMALGAVLIGSDSTVPLSDEIDTVIAVLYRPDEHGATVRTIAPCGVCRELLFDYAPNSWGYVYDWGTTSLQPTLHTTEPETERGFSGSPTIAGGHARRILIRDLLPGKNLRDW